MHELIELIESQISAGGEMHLTQNQALVLLRWLKLVEATLDQQTRTLETLQIYLQKHVANAYSLFDEKK